MRWGMDPLEETQPGDPEALRGLSNPPPPPANPAIPTQPVPPLNPPGGRVDPKETLKDTETQSQHSAQMQD